MQNATNSPSSGLNKLPSELLSYILLILFCQIDPRDYSKRLCFPLKMQFICRRWKHVVRHTPRIWAVLNVPRSSTVHVKERLELSGAVPLDVLVETGSMETENCMDDLAPHIGRWQVLHVHFGYFPSLADQDRILGLYFKHPMPQLRSLVLDAIRVPYGVHLDHMKTFDLISTFSNIRSIHLVRCAVDWEKMPLIGLEELVIQDRIPLSGSSPDTFIDFLQRSPNMRTFRTKGQFLFDLKSVTQEEFEVLVSRKSLILNDLNILEIWGTDPLDGIILLSVIDAPSLSILELDLPLLQLYSRPSSESLPRLPMKFPSLQSLRLGSLCVNQRLRLLILSQLASPCNKIRSLVLDGGQMSVQQHQIHDLFRTLWHPSFREMWDNLDHFATRQCSPGLILEFFQSLGTNPLPSLKSFYVHASDHSPIQIRIRSRKERDMRAKYAEDLGKLAAFKTWKEEENVPWY